MRLCVLLFGCVLKISFWVVFWVQLKKRAFKKLYIVLKEFRIGTRILFLEGTKAWTFFFFDNSELIFEKINKTSIYLVLTKFK